MRVDQLLRARSGMRLSAARLGASCALLAIAAATPAAAQTALTDRILFGDRTSETAHQLQDGGAALIAGATGRPARQLVPRTSGDWRSGDLSFMLKVDGARQNYVSVRLWGGDINPNKLVLACEGKQIGYRHLGDVEIMDLGTDAPSLAGRFMYRTFPLPQSLTRGKGALACAIRALGPFAVYNNVFDKFQRPMTGPARPVYALYVHNDPFLVSGEPDGAAPADPPVRAVPGSDVMERVKARVNGELERLLNAARPLNQEEMHFLARAFELDWSTAYRNSAVVRQIVAGGDALYRRYLADPDALTRDSNGGPSWIGIGPFGKALDLTKAEIDPLLDERIAGANDARVSRREAYAVMLEHSLDFLARNRRMYTNQSMIVDLLGIHYSNDGLRALGSARAWPEQRVRQFLYESVGLRPWSGSLDASGQPTASSSAKDSGTFRLPRDYHLFTPAGLSREFGYVGSYGEIQDLAASIYLATVPRRGQPGDPELLAQLTKIARARQVFRYPAIDADGYRAMVLEAYVGWRDTRFPGVITYVQRMGWDNTPLFAATVSGDPALMGAAKQMVADNQYYAVLDERMKNGNQRVTFSLLDAYQEWLDVRDWKGPAVPLPMAPEQPDFVFSDPMNAVIAVKNGAEILYASLYWRAHCGVNRLGRIHHLTPTTERVATVYGRIDFAPSGETCTRGESPQAFTGAPIFAYPDDQPIAEAGEQLPVAKGPDEARFTGKNNPYGGRGDYYETRYGSYLLAINSSAAKPARLDLPQGEGRLTNLVTKRVIPAGTRSMSVQPGQTVVIHIDHQDR